MWGDSASNPSTVIVFIRKLRDKIENDSAKPVYLETVWGTGYRFNV